MLAFTGVLQVLQGGEFVLTRSVGHMLGFMCAAEGSSVAAFRRHVVGLGDVTVQEVALAGCEFVLTYGVTMCGLV